MAGRDVMGLAQTGSGKTAAFGLPMIDMLLKEQGKPDPENSPCVNFGPDTGIGQTDSRKSGRLHDGHAPQDHGWSSVALVSSAKSANWNAALICWSPRRAV